MREHWLAISIFDICSPKQWPTIKMDVFTQSGYPVYGANGIIGRYKDYNHSEKTILIACRGATCGAINVAEGKCYVTGNAMALDELQTDIANFNYIKLFLIHYSFDNVITGSAQPQITKQSLNKIEIPLPPLNEQRRIAAKVEALQARSAKAKEALEKAQTLLEQFRQSVLAAAFRGDLTARWREEHPDAEPASAFLQRIRKERRKRWEETELAKYAAKGKTPPKDWKKKYPDPVTVDVEELPELPEGWCWASLDELIVDMHNGLGGKPAESETGLPILRISAVRPFSVNINDVRYYRPNAREHIENYFVSNGDLLYTRYNGSLELVGVCGMYKESTAILHPDKLIKVTAASATIAEYLLFVSNSGYSRLYIKSQVKSTSGQCGISNGELRRTPIPLPYTRELCVISKTLSTILKHENAVISSCNELNFSLNKVTQSILTKAFRGKLVAQDLADEPASVLLERIAAETASPAAADAKPQQVRRGRKPKSAVDPIMSFPAPGRERRLLRLMEYIIYAYPGLSTKAVEERAKLATYPTVCARLFGSRARAFRTALKASDEEWKFAKSDVVRMGRIWESLEVNYGIRISREGLCTMQDGRTPEAWPAMDTLLPLFNKAYTFFTAERHNHLDVQADLDNMGVTLKIA